MSSDVPFGSRTLCALQNDRRHFAVVFLSSLRPLKLKFWGTRNFTLRTLTFDIPRARPFTMSIRLKARRISRTERSLLPCLHAVSTMSRASSHVDFRTATFCVSLRWRRRQLSFGPLFRQTDGAGPLFRQTDGVTHVLDSASTS